jgi:hypothetical protein
MSFLLYGDICGRLIPKSSRSRTRAPMASVGRCTPTTKSSVESVLLYLSVHPISKINQLIDAPLLLDQYPGI